MLSVDFFVFELSYLYVNTSRIAASPGHGEESGAALGPRLPWFVLQHYSQRCRLVTAIAWVRVPQQ